MSSYLIHPRNNNISTNVSVFCHQTKPRVNHVVLNEAQLAQFRTHLCESHKKGLCHDADSCPHSHCLTWQRRDPYIIHYSAKLCPEIEFVRKRDRKMNLVRHCNRGRSCIHAHSKEEELYHPLMYKTKMCSAYPKCNRFYCPFAHTPDEIRKPLTMEHIKAIWGSNNNNNNNIYQIPRKVCKRSVMLEVPNTSKLIGHVKAFENHDKPYTPAIDNRIKVQHNDYSQKDMISTMMSNKEGSVCGSTTVSNSNSPKRTISNGTNNEPFFRTSLEKKHYTNDSMNISSWENLISHQDCCTHTHTHTTPCYPMFTDTHMCETYAEKNSENDSKSTNLLYISGVSTEAEIGTTQRTMKEEATSTHNNYTHNDKHYKYHNHYTHNDNHYTHNDNHYTHNDNPYTPEKSYSNKYPPHKNEHNLHTQTMLSNIEPLDQSHILHILQELISLNNYTSPVYTPLIIEWIYKLTEMYQSNNLSDKNIDSVIKMYMQYIQFCKSKEGSTHSCNTDHHLYGVGDDKHTHMDRFDINHTHQGIDQNTLHTQGIDQNTLHTQGIDQNTLHTQGIDQNTLHTQGVNQNNLYTKGIDQHNLNTYGLNLNNLYTDCFDINHSHTRGVNLNNVHAHGVEIDNNLHTQGVNLNKLHRHNINLNKIHTLDVENKDTHENNDVYGRDIVDNERKNIYIDREENLFMNKNSNTFSVHTLDNDSPRIIDKHVIDNLRNTHTINRNYTHPDYISSHSVSSTTRSSYGSSDVQDYTHTPFLCNNELFSRLNTQKHYDHKMCSSTRSHTSSSSYEKRPNNTKTVHNNLKNNDDFKHTFQYNINEQNVYNLVDELKSYDTQDTHNTLRFSNYNFKDLEPMIFKDNTNFLDDPITNNHSSKNLNFELESKKFSFLDDRDNNEEIHTHTLQNLKNDKTYDLENLWDEIVQQKNEPVLARNIYNFSGLLSLSTNN